MDGNAPSLSGDVEIRAIYHLCGDGVLEDNDYKAFMNAFCPDVHVRPYSSL
jgi:ribonuclease Z